MVNINKLKGRIVEAGINVDILATKIGCDKATLYRRLSDNGETFLIREVDAIIRELCLTKDDVAAIFFTQTVA